MMSIEDEIKKFEEAEQQRMKQFDWQMKVFGIALFVIVFFVGLTYLMN